MPIIYIPWKCMTPRHFHWTSLCHWLFPCFFSLLSSHECFGSSQEKPSGPPMQMRHRRWGDSIHVAWATGWFWITCYSWHFPCFEFMKELGRYHLFNPFYAFAIGLLVEWSPLIPNGINHIWRSTSSNNYGWSRLWPLAIKVAQPKNLPTSWKQHCMVWIFQHLTKFLL